MHLVGHGIDSLLTTHPGLRLAPSRDESIRVTGRIRFTAFINGFETIEDNYELEISIPPAFPEEVPLVLETGGRIPQDWHRNPGKSLCLGSPTTVRLMTIRAKTMDNFVKVLVVPYLYKRSYFERHQTVPMGELDHGMKGVLKEFVDLFGTSEDQAAMSMVFLTSLRRRVANKRPCPCGVGKPLGRCKHRWKINELRKELGRGWFKNQFRQIEEWRLRGQGAQSGKDAVLH